MKTKPISCPRILSIFKLFQVFREFLKFSSCWRCRVKYLENFFYGFKNYVQSIWGLLRHQALQRTSNQCHRVLRKKERNESKNWWSTADFEQKVETSMRLGRRLDIWQNKSDRKVGQQRSDKLVARIIMSTWLYVRLNVRLNHKIPEALSKYIDLEMPVIQKNGCWARNPFSWNIKYFYRIQISG